ncbi:MAG: hypothetical protein LPK01_00310 [Hymenobacteraceae bacterium]|nr:hypothetical protein [Hymenobacteraceae bacterium]
MNSCINKARLGLLFGLMFLFSGCKKPPIEHSITRSDSTIVIKEPVLVHLKGETVVNSVNLDSLRHLFQSGQQPRYITVTDKKGMVTLQHQIDLLTGQVHSSCAARDSLVILMNEMRQHYQSQQEIREIPVKPPPSFWDKLKSDFATIGFIVVVVILIWIIKSN